jgi:hypothetical protein
MLLPSTTVSPCQYYLMLYILSCYQKKQKNVEMGAIAKVVASDNNHELWCFYGVTDCIVSN